MQWNYDRKRRTNTYLYDFSRVSLFHIDLHKRGRFSDHRLSQVLGLFAVAVVCTSSGFTGVFIEKMLKSGTSQASHSARGKVCTAGIRTVQGKLLQGETKLFQGRKSVSALGRDFVLARGISYILTQLPHSPDWTLTEKTDRQEWRRLLCPESSGGVGPAVRVLSKPRIFEPGATVVVYLYVRSSDTPTTTKSIRSDKTICCNSHSRKNVFSPPPTVAMMMTPSRLPSTGSVDLKSDLHISPHTYKKEL